MKNSKFLVGIIGILLLVILVLSVLLLKKPSAVSQENETEEVIIKEQNLEMEKTEEQESDVWAKDFDEAVSQLEKFDLEGYIFSYIFDSKMNCFYSNGITDNEGCIYSRILDLDGDGKEELLTFWIHNLGSYEEGGNSLDVIVYEKTENGVDIGDMGTLAKGVLARGTDTACYRIMLKNDKYICGSCMDNTFVFADGAEYQNKVFRYDGRELIEETGYSVAGSDFTDAGKGAVDFVEDLKRIGLVKTAQAVYERDTFELCAADEGLEPLFRITVENTWEQGFGEGTPEAVCHVTLPKENDFILKDSAVRKLTEADFQGLDKEQLRLARNEIYARYGWMFEDEKLEEYFSQKCWYQKSWNIEDKDLSDIERENRDYIIKMEQR